MLFYFPRQMTTTSAYICGNGVLIIFSLSVRRTRAPACITCGRLLHIFVAIFRFVFVYECVIKLAAMVLLSAGTQHEPPEKVYIQYLTFYMKGNYSTKPSTNKSTTNCTVSHDLSTFFTYLCLFTGYPFSTIFIFPPKYFKSSRIKCITISLINLL